MFQMALCAVDLDCTPVPEQSVCSGSDTYRQSQPFQSATSKSLETISGMNLNYIHTYRQSQPLQMALHHGNQQKLGNDLWNES